MAAEKSRFITRWYREISHTLRRGACGNPPYRHQTCDCRHPSLFQSHSSHRSGLSDSTSSNPPDRGNSHRSFRNVRSLWRRLPHASSRASPPLPRPGPIPCDRPLRFLLPLLHSFTRGFWGLRSKTGDSVEHGH